MIMIRLHRVNKTRWTALQYNKNKQKYNISEGYSVTESVRCLFNWVSEVFVQLYHTCRGCSLYFKSFFFLFLSNNINFTSDLKKSVRSQTGY